MIIAINFNKFKMNVAKLKTLLCSVASYCLFYQSVQQCIFNFGVLLRFVAIVYQDLVSANHFRFVLKVFHVLIIT